jgi:hypothetical protein
LNTIFHNKLLLELEDIINVRERTGARVIFPSHDDDNQELITIIGKKEAVDQAKAELEGRIKSLVCPLSVYFLK